MKKKITNVITVILYVTYFIALYNNSDFWGNILSPIITLLSTAIVFQWYYKKESGRKNRVSGFFLSAALFSWGFCDIIWFMAEPLFKMDPEQIDLFSQIYVFMNIFLFIFAMMEYQKLKKWSGVQVIIDSLAIAMCVMILIWVIFLNKDMQSIMLMQQDWTIFISLFIDFIIFWWIAIWYLSIRKGKIPLYLRMNSTGIIIFVLTDIIYYYQYLYTEYNSNSYIDGFYVLSFAFICFSAILKGKKYSCNMKEELLNRGGRGKGLMLVVAPLILILTRGFQLEYLLILVSIIMFYQFASAFVQKSIVSEELLIRELEINIELENAVRDRTRDLEDLLNKDIITNLYNRRYLLSKLEDEIDELNADESITLFYIDINKYKMLKTMYSNYIAEKILREMGVRLKTLEQKTNDILAIYGEDVFIIARKGKTTLEQNLVDAERMVECCSGIYKIEEFDLYVTVNIGLSTYPTDAEDMEGLIRHADLSMSRAKAEGFNKVMNFDKKLSDSIMAKNKIELLLKQSHYNEEFYMNYQPQVDCYTGELIGFEALLRWKTKEGKLVSPGEFIPIAEETGCIIKLGYWIIQTVVNQVKTWNEITNETTRVAINVSAKQLIQKDFAENFSKILEKSGISPMQVEVEITETVQLDESIEIRNTIQAISNLGVSIAIDDFGTGYSSLYYIKNLPINRIKVAKELVDHVEQDRYDCTVIKSIIEIAKVRGILVIAEGVESKGQREVLKNLGCDEIQGYYFSKPLSAQDALEKWILPHKDLMQ